MLMISSLFHLFLLLGSEWVLWVLVAAVFVALTVFFDRWRTLRNQEKVGHLLWREHLHFWVTDGAPSEWVGACAQLATEFPCTETKVLLALSKKPRASAQDLERAAQSILTTEKLQLEKYLAILGTLGNSAPFIGLFGTVLGIIKAFSELDRSTANSGLTAISGGLAEALVTTAAGLVVAIPCAMAYNFFIRKIKTIQARSLSLAGVVIAERGERH